MSAASVVAVVLVSTSTSSMALTGNPNPGIQSRSSDPNALSYDHPVRGLFQQDVADQLPVHSEKLTRGSDGAGKSATEDFTDHIYLPSVARADVLFVAPAPTPPSPEPTPCPDAVDGNIPGAHICG